MKFDAVIIDQNLVGHSWIGKVDSVFDSVCNVTLSNNEILVLADSNLPMMPNGVAINSFRPKEKMRLRPGQRIECNAKRIYLESSHSIHIENACSWSGKVAFNRQNVSKEQLHIRWNLLAIQVKKKLPDVLKPLTWHPWFKSGPLCTTTTIRTIKSLAKHHAPYSESGKLLKHMLGLGPGLTPSGDDFTVGYLAVCHTLGSLNKREDIKKTNEYLSPILRSTTTNISCHYLMKALKGEFVESLASLMSSLISLNNLKLRIDISNVLDKFGHSSGVDCCFGVLVGSAQYCGVGDYSLNEFLPAQTEK